MRKVFKVVLYVVGAILFLLIGILIWLNTPPGENFVRTKVQVYLQDKLKTQVLIGKLGYGLPKYVVLENVLLRDQNNDTLLAVQKLKVDLDMLKLIRKEVDVNQLVLQGVHSHIYRNAPDTNFNFSYIIAAFASNTPGKAVTNPERKISSSASLSINVNRIDLDDIHVRMDDATGGVRLAADLLHLDLKMKDIDLKNMNFHVKDLTVAGLQTFLYQDTSYLPVKKKDTAQSKFTLVADNVALKQIAFKYTDNLNKLLLDLDVAALRLKVDKFDLATQVVKLARFVVDSSNIKLAFGKKSKAPSAVDSMIGMDTTHGWNIAVKEMEIAGVNFKMDDANVARQPSGIDYAHLNVRGLVLNSQDIKYTSDTIAGNIKQLSVREQSGVDVREFRTKFIYQQRGAILTNLYLRTPNTTIQDFIEVKYPSLAVLKKDIGQMQLNVNISKSVIGLGDVLVFAPDLIKQPIFKKYRNGHLQLDAGVTGQVNNMAIARFTLAGLGNTVVILNGRLAGLPNPDRIKYNLNITRLTSSRNDISALVPPAMLSSVRLPDKFGITGKLSGTINDYYPDLLLMSTDGIAYLRGYVRMSGGKGQEQYDMFVKTVGLNVGRILKDTLMSTVSLYTTVKGRGFDVKTMAATMNGGIQAAQVKGYNYNNIIFNGDIAGKLGNVKLASTDNNLRLNMTAHADMTGKYPAVKADIQMDSVDLQALKMYNSELKIHGHVLADFPVLDPDYPQGKLVWQQPLIVAGGQRYILDSLFVVSRPDAGTGQYIVANLDVMHAVITGKTPLTKLGAIIQDHIGRHYRLPGNDSAQKAVAVTKRTNYTGLNNMPAEYNLLFTARVEDRPLLHSLFPGLTSMDTIHVDGSLTPRQFALNASIPGIIYGTNTLEHGVVKVRGADSAITYSVTADKLAASQVVLWYANIHGNMNQDIITANVSLSDSVKKERFALAMSFQNAGDSQVVQLQPGLKLNYQTWTVTQPNKISISKGGFYVANLNISNNNQYLKINSDQPTPNSPLKVAVSNFQLANITQMISRDTALVNGVLGGNITIQKLQPSIVLSGNLKVDGLSVLGDTLGNLTAQVNTTDGNDFNTKLALKGSGNDIGLNGHYYLNPVNANGFNFELVVKALSLASMQGIAMNQIRNSSGFIRGKLQLQGTPAAPQITGELHTDNLTTTVSTLDAYFKLPADKVTFTSSGMTFNDFQILDSSGNKATVNGTIGTQDLKNLRFDLQLDAKNWRAVHSTSQDNKIVYGDLIFTTNLHLKGTPTAPDVDGSIAVLKGTNLTVVMPENNPGLVSGEGIVEFVDKSNPGMYTILLPRSRKDSTSVMLPSGSNVNVNISADKQATFSVIIDQASGDFLSVKGDGALNAFVTPGGTFGLSGNYELTEGVYQLNYNFVKRKFLIQKGSSITFAGDPTNANADITAIYEATAAAYDLVQREVPDPAQLNYYKQNLPFNVAMHIRGAILQPALTFDILLPENRIYPLAPDQVELIRGKLNQVRNDTSELNKQVFALLILGRFVSDNPFSNGAATSVAFTAKESASRFIGEQLSQFANHLVKGVDLSVDLASTEDYTTGSLRDRTDLNLAASKRLLNDRLKLTIGNDFELEGPQATNSDQNNLIPSNLAADYLLAPDGRYTVRAYRKNYNEGVIQGYVTETGIDFIVSLDYNRFRNAIKRKNNKKEQSNGATK